MRTALGLALAIAAFPQAVLACNAMSPTCRDPESFLDWMVVGQALSKPCPGETEAALAGVPVGELEDGRQIARRREIQFTAKVKYDGIVPAASTAVTSYEDYLSDQVGRKVSQLGCPLASRLLGFYAPPGVVLRPGLIRFVAGRYRIPATDRGPNVANPVGTQAGIDLEAVVTAQVLEPGCDRASLKATLVKKQGGIALNPPPYIGLLWHYTERWEVACAGQKRAYEVSFLQDARKFRRYALKKV